MSRLIRHKIAQRMHVLLQRELGQGIDVKRLLGQPLYARDVLLVCDALRETDLAVLAQQYRAASADEADTDARASVWPEGAEDHPSIWPKSWVRAGRWLIK